MTEPTREELALAIVDSEPFMWLMAGSNHTEAQLASLRSTFAAYTKLGGGWGNKMRGKGAWAKEDDNAV